MNHSLESVNTPSLSVFNFHNQPVRLLTCNNDPWFVAKDICTAVEIRNSRHAMSRLDNNEKDDVALDDAIGRKQRTAIVSESGMYALVLSSRKPSAKIFRKWVTSEVLPTIRKTGCYFRSHSEPPTDQFPITNDQYPVTDTQNLISNIQNLKLKIAQQPDIYRLIFSSRLKEAINFQKWIFEYVLPAVCQTGQYLQLIESEFAPIARPENRQQPIVPGEYDDLDTPIDLDEQFTKIDYVFDALPYDCRQDLTVEIQKARVLQELIAAFPKDRKFIMGRDTAIGVAAAERYFTIEQLADRLERLIFEPCHADDVTNLLDKMDYIKAVEGAEEVTITNSAKFFTQRIAGELKWRSHVLPLLLREYKWQRENG